MIAVRRAARHAAIALASFGGVAILFVLGAGAREPGAQPAGNVERGEYLAQRVAMCVECHTPRSSDGELDRTRLFQGAPIPVTSPFRGREWASKAPAIAGLVGFTDDAAITLLSTGHRPTGEVPRPPMPAFRMSHEDAAAVAAYLRSLPAVP